MRGEGASVLSQPAFTVSFHPKRGDRPLAARLAREIDAEVLFDAASRGRYSTDASIYQIDPVGVVVPRTEDAAKGAIQIAVEEGVPVLPRGAGSSQCGQTVGAALVIDTSKHLNRVLEFDAAGRVAVVQPGMVLDRLNAFLRPHGLWFPVDVSTSAQATIGGMTGNNSCGSRSIAYGNMVHNVLGVDAVLADGSECHFGSAYSPAGAPPRLRELVGGIDAIVAREAGEIERRWPKVLRRVQGYNLDMAKPGAARNLAHLLVGSEGTLAYSGRIHLKLSPLPARRALGVCHFASFHEAMQAPQHIVQLAPTAVELVDRTMMGLARGNPAFRATVERFIRGDPDAVLLVEFAGEDRDEQSKKLNSLTALMGDLGHPRSVIEITDARLQREVWEVRKAGLNIMMSMKGEGKPVSFIEDCAVPLEHLPEYTRRLSEVFARHGTEGTWYAHASVGCLHVRPILNMKADGARKMRAIAEEACAFVREYRGAYSGEHGDGLARSEWIEPILGPRLAAALAEIKALFDPKGLMNPGKIVRPPRQDDRSLFRYRTDYRVEPIATALDWGDWGGFGPAVEMCNNNGHCRKFDAGTMCPSFRATGNESDLTRGRANTLRLAISGQLAGMDANAALGSDALYQTMDLCVGCKGCKRECPTGVDMARMKIEFLHHYHARRGYSMRDRLIARLPRYAPWAARFAWLANLRDRVPGLARASESLLGFSARRSLPRWRRDTYLSAHPPLPRGGGAERGGVAQVVLFPDCFNNYFEPENLRAAQRVLQAAGCTVHVARAQGRPLCCGRTFLAMGMVDEARMEAGRMLQALLPFAERGVALVGLEPSCLLTLRDEYLNLGLGEAAAKLGPAAQLFEEYLARELDAGRLTLELKPLARKKALLHGHCHQKAFDAMAPVHKVLQRVPGLAVEQVESSCCGMAGAFGYDAEHFEVSMKMAEASLLPRVREAGEDTLVLADGASCRHQIRDGAARDAIHVARALELAL